MLTNEQREAAIEQMALSIWASDGLGRSEGWDRTPNQGVYRRRAAAALKALTDAGYLVLSRDDVTEEESNDMSYTPLVRLVTRWEPITKEDVGPWTTQETP